MKRYKDGNLVYVELEGKESVFDIEKFDEVDVIDVTNTDRRKEKLEKEKLDESLDELLEKSRYESLDRHLEKIKEDHQFSKLSIGIKLQRGDNDVYYHDGYELVLEFDKKPF